MNLDKRIKKMTEEAETHDGYFRRELKVDKIKEQEERKRLRDIWKRKKQFPR